MTATMQKANVKYYLHCIIGLGLMFGLGLLPPISPITPLGMQILGIFLGLIYLWSAVDTIWPSIMGIIALGLSDYCTISEAIYSGMGNPLVWQIIMIMILAGALGQTNLGRVVSTWLLGRKILQGRPLLFSGTFLIGTFILSILVSIPAVWLSWAIIYSLAEMFGYKKGDKYITTMLIGIFVAFILGTATIPFAGIRAALCNAFAGIAGFEISYGLYMLMAFLLAILLLVLYLLSMKFVFKVDMSKLSNFSSEKLIKDKVTLTRQEKACVYGFLAGILAIIISSVCPKSWLLVRVLNTLTLSGIFALIVVILSLIRLDGKPIINFVQLAPKSIQWNMIFIIVCILPVSTALSSDLAGINAMFLKILTPVFAGKGAIVLVILVVVSTLILTNIGSNVGMGLMLIPIVVSVSEIVGANTYLLGMILIYLTNIAYMLPGASPLAAIMYGNDWVTPKEIYYYGGYAIVLMALLTCLVIYPLFNIFTKNIF